MNKINFKSESFAQMLCDCLKITREELDIETLKKIKYLRVADEDGGITMEVSTACPPEPFSSTDGGDEWAYACFLGNDIQSFLEDEKTSLDELYPSCDMEEWEYAWSEEATEKWDDFKKSIVRIEYYWNELGMEHEEWEKWAEDFDISEDIEKLSELEVLRINNFTFDNYEFFGVLRNLRVVEVQETVFQDSKGVENLYKLQQLCCWLD